MSLPFYQTKLNDMGMNGIGLSAILFFVLGFIFIVSVGASKPKWAYDDVANKWKWGAFIGAIFGVGFVGVAVGMSYAGYITYDKNKVKNYVK